MARQHRENEFLEGQMEVADRRRRTAKRPPRFDEPVAWGYTWYRGWYRWQASGYVWAKNKTEARKKALRRSARTGGGLETVYVWPDPDQNDAINETARKSLPRR